MEQDIHVHHGINYIEFTVTDMAESKRFYQAAFDDLNRVRRSLQAELAYEAGQIAFSESAFAGRTQSAAPRLGYRNKVRGLVRELIKRIAMVDAQIEFVLDDARKAGASVDKR